MCTNTDTATMPSPTALQPSAGPYFYNILLTSFAGLGLPRTLSLQVNSQATTGDVVRTIHSRLPRNSDRLIISTTDNKQLLISSESPVCSLVPEGEGSFIPLRLSAKLCGGKGGFGSQLRAAGGRMSSRKNRDQQQNVNGSNRNLDGRRLRTVEEAKRLADYLAIKPEMEKKEKEERKKRWEAVVDAAERREAEIKSGKVGANQGRLDAAYVEDKELAEEKTREAVLKAMREGLVERTGSESSQEQAGGSEEEEDVSDESSGSLQQAKKKDISAGRLFFGWDDEDDDDDSEDEDEAELAEPATQQGKGKGRAA